MNAARFNLIADITVELLSSAELPANARALLESAIDELQKPEKIRTFQIVGNPGRDRDRAFFDMFAKAAPKMENWQKGIVDLFPGDTIQVAPVAFGTGHVVTINRPSRMRRTYRLRGQSLIARVLHAPSYYVTLRKVVVFRRSALRHTIHYVMGK